MNLYLLLLINIWPDKFIYTNLFIFFDLIKVYYEIEINDSDK